MGCGGGAGFRFGGGVLGAESSSSSGGGASAAFGLAAFLAMAVNYKFFWGPFPQDLARGAKSGGSETAYCSFPCPVVELGVFPVAPGWYHDPRRVYLELSLLPNASIMIRR
jgi:hypothetical protein